jgi:hypothetical protein
LTACHKWILRHFNADEINHLLPSSILPHTLAGMLQRYASRAPPPGLQKGIVQSV